MNHYVFAQATDYPFLTDWANDDSEYHEAFDESFLALSERMYDTLQKNPRLEMYMHGVFTNGEVEATLKVVGYMEKPFMMVLEVPKDMHYMFQVEEETDRLWYESGYYFLDDDEYRTQDMIPFHGQEINISNKHIYFGAYMDKFYTVEARAATNSAVKNRLDTIDS